MVKTFRFIKCVSITLLREITDVDNFIMIKKFKR